jgi:hypothetical protein
MQLDCGILIPSGELQNILPGGHRGSNVGGRTLSAQIVQLLLLDRY